MKPHRLRTREIAALIGQEVKELRALGIHLRSRLDELERSVAAKASTSLTTLARRVEAVERCNLALSTHSLTTWHEDKLEQIIAPIIERIHQRGKNQKGRRRA